MDALWVVFLGVTTVAPYIFPVAVLGLLGALVYVATRRGRGGKGRRPGDPTG